VDLAIKVGDWIGKFGAVSDLLGKYATLHNINYAQLAGISITHQYFLFLACLSSKDLTEALILQEKPHSFCCGYDNKS
jgi:hypothetical protein